MVSARIFLCYFAIFVCCSFAVCQTQPANPPSYLDQLNAMISAGNGVWTPEQIATMQRLRDAAMRDPYALDELRHLTDNIGPRLSGSPQAQQAVEWVAAQMRELGAEVTLEKAMCRTGFGARKRANLCRGLDRLPAPRRR